MSRRRIDRIAGLLLAALAPVLGHAQGVLEIPGPSSHQSGIGLISGWHCSAQRIEISIDGGPPIAVSSRTPRADTAGVCGRSDTGFAMTFNWGILPHDCFGCAIHRVTALADGVPFATSEFSVAYLGAEYLTGKSGSYLLKNFPDLNTDATVRWDEQKQNFSITGISGPTPLLRWGPYVGAVQTGATRGECIPPIVRDYPLRYGRFTVTPKDGTLSLKAEYADGGTCELPAVPMDFRTTSNWNGGSVRAVFSAAQTAACPEFPGGLTLTASQERISAVTTDQCWTGNLRATVLD